METIIVARLQVRVEEADEINTDKQTQTRNNSCLPQDAESTSTCGIFLKHSYFGSESNSMVHCGRTNSNMVNTQLCSISRLCLDMQYLAP